MISQLCSLTFVNTKVSGKTIIPRNFWLLVFEVRDCLSVGMRGKIHSESVSSLSLLFCHYDSQFCISILKRRYEHICICVLIGQQEKIACMCIHSISQACAPFLFYIPSAMSATGCSLLGNSHGLAVCCPPNILYTSLGHKAHRLFTEPQDIKAGYPSLYKWEKWGPKTGCHLNRNSDQVSSSLSPIPPILLTNDSGRCHFILYMWTFGLLPPPTDHSGSKQVSWENPDESRDVKWLSFPSSWNTLSCLVCSWLLSEMESCDWSATCHLCWVFLFPFP